MTTQTSHPLPQPRTFRIGYQSPESGYYMQRPKSYTVTTEEELIDLLDSVQKLNDADSKRLGVTFQLRRQRD